MKTFGPVRSALFVPGNRPERVDKAALSHADTVIIDMEDAVPLSQKKEVRAKVKEKLLEHSQRKMLVRVNALDSSFFSDDLEEIVVKDLNGIIIPKIASFDHMRESNEQLLNLERERDMKPGSIPIIALIESAEAVQNVYQIASEKTEPQRLVTLAFGAADYCLDLGIELSREGTELSYVRSRLAIACRAGKLDPPLDTPFMIDLKDVEGFIEDARKAKQLGFQGKLCIHPNQVDPCNAVFSPTTEEVGYAKRVISAFEKAEAEGQAAVQLDGRFIDYPIVERARRIIALAGAINGY